MSEGISFLAIFNKATTTPDGGWIVSFAVDQSEATKIVQLAQLRDDVLSLGIVPANERFRKPEGESHMDALDIEGLDG